MITVNGQKVNDAEDMVLTEFLSREGHVLTRVAVECNGEIVPKETYNRKFLADGDVLEIVHFVGGG